MRMFPVTDGVPNFHLVQAVTEMRIDELQKEAERERMLDQLDSARTRFLDRLMIDIGSYLVLVGKKLLERYVPVMPQRSEACPTDY